MEETIDYRGHQISISVSKKGICTMKVSPSAGIVESVGFGPHEGDLSEDAMKEKFNECLRSAKNDIDRHLSRANEISQ